MELSPANAVATVWYAIVLYTQGRIEEGLKLAELGVELDPMTPFNHHNVGGGLYFARRYPEAIERYRHVIIDFPSYGFGARIVEDKNDRRDRACVYESEVAHDHGKGIHTAFKSSTPHWSDA